MADVIGLPMARPDRIRKSAVRIMVLLPEGESGGPAGMTPLRSAHPVGVSPNVRILSVVLCVQRLTDGLGVMAEHDGEIQWMDRYPTAGCEEPECCVGLNVLGNDGFCQPISRKAGNRQGSGVAHGIGFRSRNLTSHTPTGGGRTDF